MFVFHVISASGSPTGAAALAFDIFASFVADTNHKNLKQLKLKKFSVSQHTWNLGGKGIEASWKKIEGETRKALF